VPDHRELVGGRSKPAEQKREDEAGRDRHRKADHEGEERAPREVEATLHEGDCEPRQRAELGADHHRTDDQDLRVGHDPGGRDQRREHHEGDEAEGKLRALGGAGLDLFPDDGVGRRSARSLLGLPRHV
jgi:hypothetical protein